MGPDGRGVVARKAKGCGPGAWRRRTTRRRRGLFHGLATKGRPARPGDNEAACGFQLGGIVLATASPHLSTFAEQNKMHKRVLLQSVAAIALAGAFLPAHAQALTPIKFQLDWRFEGPAALFL